MPVWAVVLLVPVTAGCAEDPYRPETTGLTFVADRWTVTADSIHTVFMIADISPLTRQ